MNGKTRILTESGPKPGGYLERVQDSYKNMADAVEKEYGVVLRKPQKTIGISAMMHGPWSSTKMGNC